ncbi:hypothetical protein C809_01576 [Lachnospiraceae bacterium MD335]|nr:hypothetical protein C809_01576 [Lachnospiraceae bacterium MD335]
MVFVITGITGALLFAAGIMDLRSREISRGMILILMLVGLLGAVVNRSIGIWEIVGGALIGVCAVGLSMVGREQIGRGDGLVIIAMGLILGFRKCLTAVCIASLIMTLVSVFVLVLRKGNRHTRLAFIPALFIGYVVCVMMTG